MGGFPGVPLGKPRHKKATDGLVTPGRENAGGEA